MPLEPLSSAKPLLSEQSPTALPHFFLSSIASASVVGQQADAKAAAGPLMTIIDGAT